VPLLSPATEPPAAPTTSTASCSANKLPRITPSLHKQLTNLAPRLGLEIEDFTPAKKYDVTSDVGGIQATTQLGHIDTAILEAVRTGTPLVAIPQADSLSDGVAKQLAADRAFNYNGTVGDYRAPWMGK
jgi:beta-galactosidase